MKAPEFIRFENEDSKLCKIDFKEVFKQGTEMVFSFGEHRFRRIEYIIDEVFSDSVWLKKKVRI